MSRLVQCRKYNTPLDGLEAPPFPGPQGEAIYEQVSKKAWQEWLGHQTRLINEKHLKLFEPSTQAYLQQEMEKFLNNEAFEQAEGYVPDTNNPENNG